MANGRNAYQSRENRQRVRAVLMEHWDPVGVSDIPEASDEYDAYVGDIDVMLMDHRASEDEIEAYLDETAAEHMGLGHDEAMAECCATTAQFLVGLRPQFETH